MNIAYTFDDGYSKITAVSIASLLESNKLEREINILIVDCGIQAENKNKLIELVKSYNRSIKFFNGVKLEEKFNTSLKCLSWSPVCYERLFYHEIFASYDKVLHVDCDTLVLKNLSNTYNLDINNYFLAACLDCSPSPKKMLKFSHSQKYFSAGFMLLNLNKMRLENTTDKIVNIVNLHNGVFPHLDQDVFNLTYENRILLLDAQYNVMTPILLYDSLCSKVFYNNEYYTPKQLRYASKNPAVIHFTGCLYTRRPWDQPCFHKYNYRWLSYLNLTPYPNSKKLLFSKKRKFSFIKSILFKIWLIVIRIPIIRNITFLIDKKIVLKVKR